MFASRRLDGHYNFIVRCFGSDGVRHHANGAVQVFWLNHHSSTFLGKGVCGYRAMEGATDARHQRRAIRIPRHVRFAFCRAVTSKCQQRALCGNVARTDSRVRRLAFGTGPLEGLGSRSGRGSRQWRIGGSLTCGGHFALCCRLRRVGSSE